MAKIFAKTLAAAFLLAAVLGAALPARASNQALKDKIRQILKENPQIIFEVLAQDKLTLFKLAAQGGDIMRRKKWEDSIRRNMRNPLKPALDPKRAWIGPKDAPVTIVEYTDFMCGACAAGSGYVKALLAKYPKGVRLLLKHAFSDDLSRQLALYFEAIARQGTARAWRFADQVYRRQAAIRKDGLAAAQKIIDGLKLDPKRLARDLADPALEQRLEKDLDEAEEMNFQSTPTFVVNGVPVEGAVPVNGFEEMFAVMGIKLRPGK